MKRKRGNLSFQNIRTADWSTAVALFLNVVIDSTLNPTDFGLAPFRLGHNCGAVTGVDASRL